MAKGRRPQGLHRADVIRTLRFTPAQDCLFELLKTRRGRLSVADMVKFWMISEARRVVPNAPELAAVEREGNWQLGLFNDPRNADAPPSSSAPAVAPSRAAAAVKLDEAPPAELEEAAGLDETPAAELDEGTAAPAAELDEGTAAPAAELDEQEVDEDTLDSAERAWSYPKCAAGCGSPGPFGCETCTAPLCARLECRVKHEDETHAPPVVNVPDVPDGDGDREYVPIKPYARRCLGSEFAGVLLYRDGSPKRLSGEVQCMSCKHVFKGRVGKGMSSILRPHMTDGTLLPHHDQEQAICPGSYIDGYSDTPEDLHESVTCAVCFKKLPPGKGGPLLPAWHDEHGLVIGPFKTPRPKLRASTVKSVVAWANQPSKGAAKASKGSKASSSTSKGAAKASKGSKASSSTSKGAAKASKPRARKGAA